MGKIKGKILIILCVFAICLLCAPNRQASFAQTHPFSTNLISPQSICVDVENNLFISDKTGGTAVIYRYTDTSRTTVYAGEHSAFSRIRFGGGKVFGIYDNTLVILNNIVTQNFFKITLNTDTERLVNFDVNDSYLLCLVERRVESDYVICRVPIDSIKETTNLTDPSNKRFTLPDVIDIAVNNTQIYLLCKGALTRLAYLSVNDTVPGYRSDEGNSNRVYAYGNGDYMLSDGEKLDGKEVMFNNKSLVIADAAYYDGNNLYLLDVSGNNGLKMVARFSAALKQIDLYVGSNSLDNFAPLPYNSVPNSDEIMPARVTGYPSNIVYTIDPQYVGTDEGKIPARLCMAGHILDYDTLFLILNYKSATSYYFIFYNVKQENGTTIGQFGWVEKNSSVVPSQDNLSDSVFDNCEQLGQSLRIYALPSTAEEYVLQTFSGDPSEHRQNVLVLYDLWNFDAAEGRVKWKYVAFGENKYGFVLASEIREKRDIVTAVRAKANPPFGKSLPLYESRDKGSRVIANLSSGEDLLLIKTLGNMAFVSAYVNGTWEYGYIDSSMFILKGLTNNQALGITLSVALILLAGFTVFVLVRRYKFNKKSHEDDE